MLINGKSPHGGDIYTRYAELDFSANINPAGMPDAVTQALLRAARNCVAYPDPYCTRLRGAIAEAEGIGSERILCGNGAAELIYSFAFALPKDAAALVIVPSFRDYETALRSAGIRVEYHYLREENGFRLTEDILRRDFSAYGAVLLCSPNNPTGITIPPDLLEAIAATGVRLLCDLCFMDLTDFPQRYDIPGLVDRYPNLTVLRAFTKSYAMAGVRLGYALCGDVDFLGEMSAKVPCWNVSTLAQEAGVAALSCQKWLRNSVAAISRERTRMVKSLEALGIRVWPGEANFLLLHCDRPLEKLLADRGILIRDCSNYAGLAGGYFRIAIRAPWENDKLLAELKEVLQ